eukprot:SAG11_NODE_2973_length_2800_cov_1.339134_5_plen_35_part_01
MWWQEMERNSARALVGWLEPQLAPWAGERLVGSAL